MTLKAQMTEIRKTGHMHRNWYLETYPDVARLGMEPAEHYLKYGAALGRNPGKNFDTKFYLSHYPDVKEAGMNPLLHYARFGKKEQRDTGGDTAHRRAFNLLDYLWSSQETDRVISLLEEMAHDQSLAAETQFQIGRKLAVRHAYNDDMPRALACIDALPAAVPDYIHKKEYLVLRGFLHLQAGDLEAARTYFERFLKTIDGARDPDALLGLSNTCTRDADRLAQINQVYTNAGLAPLRMIDPDLPLAINNIVGTDVPSCTEDYGLVSVIMPIYMAEDIIETAIRSLCAQSYRNIEIIAVDDCSPDGTFAVLERLAAKDPRIRPVRQKANAGAYPARNHGLKVAQGAFITTHDADDWSHPQKIEKQIRALMGGNAKGVVVHWVRVLPSLHVTTNWRASSETLHWSHSTFLARRALFDSLGPWDNVRISADTEMIWRMQAAHGWNSLQKIIPDAPLALALDDDSSLTRTKQTHVSTIYFGLRRFYREIAQHWHRRPDGLSEQSHAKRLAMIPDEMFQKPDGPVCLDLLLRGDCTDPNITRKMHETLKDPLWSDKLIGVDHVPDITRVPGKFAPGFFDVLALPGVRLVVPGTTIEAAQEIDLNG